MKRRKFLKIGGVASLGTLMLPGEVQANILGESEKPRLTAKNLIFMVSDGMSNGTLSLTDLYARKLLGKPTAWIQSYSDSNVKRALMDMSSANSSVTDSAAASSSWGGGVRVNNGSLNVDPEGNFITPIWQKFKEMGKKVGCVTTVPITHATPAGFAVAVKKRNDQSLIAEKYLEKGYDVLLGGGQKYFDGNLRKDGVDMYAKFAEQGYFVAKSKGELQKLSPNQKVLGVFDTDALPYYIDTKREQSLAENIPSLAEMTKIAIQQMEKHEDGFVLQIESGKVDWAAHGNDIGALIHEQLQFDEALEEVLKFAREDNDTIVIFTTDHGNANPGLIYGKNVDDFYTQISNYKCSNEHLLNLFSKKDTVKSIQSTVEKMMKIELTVEEAEEILSYYTGIKKEDDGLYNYKKVPFKLFSEIQSKRNRVGWISMDHSSDYVELAVYKPCRVKDFIKKGFYQNIELHQMMLKNVMVYHNKRIKHYYE